MKRAFKTAVSIVTAMAFVVTGCSRSVRVPEKKLAPSTEWEGLYRVTTTTDQFTTRDFSVTDSTLVITKLGGSDKHYGIAKPPLAIPLTEVKSVEKLETANGRTSLLVLGILAVVAAMVWLASPWDSSLD